MYHQATNTRNIAKAACMTGLPCIVKFSLIQSNWGVAVILSHVSVRRLANIIKVEAITAYIPGYPMPLIKVNGVVYKDLNLESMSRCAINRHVTS